MEFYDVLQAVRLFKGIEREDLASMLSCLGAKIMDVSKDDFILSAGSKAEHVGIVLDGWLTIIKEDIDGGRVLLARLEPGDFFAEALCCADVSESPVSVMANTDAKVMLLEFRRILHTCPSLCSFHAVLIENMLFVLAMKNLQLQARMEFLGKKTIRDKVMSYLQSVAIKQGRVFTIPFNREDLANFLCIDRSALSRELARLKEEGIINYRKSQFELKNDPGSER